MIRKYQDQFSKQEILAVAGISRQSYFKYLQQNTLAEEKHEQVRAVVTEARKLNKRMGARSIFYTYDVDFMGVSRFEKLVSELGIGVAKRPKKRIITTNGQHEDSDQNLISGLCLNACRQAIAGDITYYWGNGSLYYIFTLKDLYSGLTLGLTGSRSLRTEAAIQTLDQALQSKDYGTGFYGTIHHTDAGSQYKSVAYTKMLLDNGLRISIAENCLENGAAEQFNGLLKNDYLRFEQISNDKQLNTELQRIKKYLNEVRKVKQIGFRTPVEFETAMMNLPPEQRMQKRLYDFKKRQEVDRSHGPP